MTKVNAQQFPKVQGILECFLPPPGCVLIDSDLASIEPKVAATFSRDPTLLELYASGKPHDVYLYNAAFLMSNGKEIAEVYQLDNPTLESVSEAKRRFKRERGIAKTVTLAAGYGASANKMYQTMRLGGLPVTLDDVVSMRARYWELYAGLRRWGRALEREREDRGGWIYNGHGRPLAIPDYRLKDIMNAFCQSTGHDSLLTLIWYLDKFRRERGVPMVPWLVDFHDQSTWAVPLTKIEEARSVFRDAYAALNRDLACDIPITGNIDVAENFWELKK